MHPFSSDQKQGLTEPIAEYRQDGHCSITGGFVVRSPSLPDWAGIYIFGDYCTGAVWGLLRTATDTWEMEGLFQSGARISSFGEDNQGNIYLIDLGGDVFRLEALEDGGGQNE
jgi:hypothetical protein